MSKQKLREFAQFINATVEYTEGDTIQSLVEYAVYVHLSPWERIKLSLSMLFKAAIDAAKAKGGQR